MKYFKLIGVMSLLVFSFFLTDFVTELAINNNSLMQEIKYKSSEYTVSSVNAIIDSNTIIPGIRGKIINEVESYLNMKDFGKFNKNYLIYDSVIPDISLENNKDKVIISGNRLKREVSILIYNNENVLKYSKNINIKYTKLIKLDNNIDKENVNIESSVDNYRDLNTLLKKNNKNNKICIINYSNIEECINNEYYLIRISKELSNSNINSSLSSISNGDILYIDDKFTIDNYKLLLKYLNNKDIKIVYLSKLIQE